MKENNDIRAVAVGAGVPLWKVAEKLGILDSSLSRLLRKELSEQEKNKIRGIIREISAKDNRPFNIHKEGSENT
jgi:hypothetical protein